MRNLPDKKMKGARVKREMQYLLMLLPGLVFLAVFQYTPMGGVIIAFQKFNPIKGLFGDQQWAGLDNFRKILINPYFWPAVRNTLQISVQKLVWHKVAAIGLALLLNEIKNRTYRRTLQTVFYLPHFISWVILGILFKDILASDGLINNLLQSVNLPTMKFFTNKSFQSVLVVTDVWKEFGFNSIIFLAAVTGIDPALYEAAIVDGASKIRRTWHITLPGIRPIIVLTLLLDIGGIFGSNFDQIFNMYNTTLMQSGDVISTLVYRLGIVEANYALSTAIGLAQSVISCILVSVSYALAYYLADYRIF